jgi:hypothetical protein
MEYIQQRNARDLWVKREQYSPTDLVRQMAGLPQAEREKFQKLRDAANAKAAPKKPQNGPVKPKRQGYGRFEVLNNFVDEWAHEFSSPQRSVWLWIFRHSRSVDGGRAYICKGSSRTIAIEMKVSRRTVQTAIDKMLASKLLRVVFQSTAKGVPSKYELMVSKRTDEALTERPSEKMRRNK